MVMAPTTLKIMCLPQNPLGPKWEHKQSVNCKKWIHCQVSGMVLLLLHKGLTPSGWHRKTVCRFFVWRIKMKGNWVQTPFQTFILFCLLRSVKTLEIELRPALLEKTDPIGAGKALRSGSVNFILKMLLLELSIYSMTTRPHYES